jgi:hypothetical protein
MLQLVINEEAFVHCRGGNETTFLLSQVSVFGSEARLDLKASLVPTRPRYDHGISQSVAATHYAPRLNRLCISPTASQHKNVSTVIMTLMQPSSFMLAITRLYLERRGRTSNVC